MKLKIKLASSKNDLKNVLKIRRRVFINEQQIPTSIEIDENENKSFYILAYFESQPVGTARWRDSGEGIKLERFAVLKQFRKNIRILHFFRKLFFRRKTRLWQAGSPAWKVFKASSYHITAYHIKSS